MLSPKRNLDEVYWDESTALGARIGQSMHFEWLERRNEDLDGMTPAQACDEGYLDDVKRVFGEMIQNVSRN